MFYRSCLDARAGQENVLIDRHSTGGLSWFPVDILSFQLLDIHFA